MYQRSAAMTISPQAEQLHRSLLIIDGHCDSALDAIGVSETQPDMGIRDLALRGHDGHIDVPRLLEAGVATQIFALFTTDTRVAEATAHTWRLLEAMEDLCARCPSVRLVHSSAEIRQAKLDKVLGAILAIEGGEAIGSSLDSLRQFYKRGVRLMTLTWNRRNAIGRGVGTEGSDGLSAFGRTVVAEMEHLGMIVDVSHLSDAALDDTLDICTRPLVASHSNAKALKQHRRNLSDDQARRIAATGGLIGITFAGSFIDEDPAKVTLARVLDHLDHMVEVAGIEHVGLGTDFDGFTAQYGTVMPDCTGLPALTAGLLERGYTKRDIELLMGQNWLRVIEAILG